MRLRQNITATLLLVSSMTIIAGTLPVTSFSPGYDSVYGFNHTNPAEIIELYQEVQDNKASSPDSILGTISLKGPTLPVEPVNLNSSIIIPNINVNSPIVFDVSVSNKPEYQSALEQGVAHAAGTHKPTSEDSNTYLFAHSTADERHIARYAAVFTKLRELEINNDTISIFYQGKRYDYIVHNKEIVQSFETSVLTRDYGFPAITLQTCDPPGQALNRLLVTGRLIGVYDE